VDRAHIITVIASISTLMTGIPNGPFTLAEKTCLEPAPEICTGRYRWKAGTLCPANQGLLLVTVIPAPMRVHRAAPSRWRHDRQLRPAVRLPRVLTGSVPDQFGSPTVFTYRSKDQTLLSFNPVNAAAIGQLASWSWISRGTGLQLRCPRSRRKYPGHFPRKVSLPMTDPAIDMIVQQLCGEFTAAAKIDYVGFWELVAAVSKWNPQATDCELADVTLAVSRCMINRGLRVFTFIGGKPPPAFWNAPTTDEILDRIRKEWSLLHGKSVGLGDVCWFAAPAGCD
jgi:hypothetical protein